VLSKASGFFATWTVAVCTLGTMLEASRGKRWSLGWKVDEV